MTAQNKQSQSTDLTNIDQVVEDYLPLVRHIARHIPLGVAGPIMQLDDLVSCGTIGLIEAARRYDASVGTSFASFAAIRIRGAMMDALRSTDPLSRPARQRARQLNVAETKLSFELGREPTPEEVRAEVGMSVVQYRETTRATSQSAVSLEGVLSYSNSDEDDSPRELACENDDDPGGIEYHELLESLVDAIKELPVRDRQLIGLRYDQGLTLNEVAEVMGISPSRVSQIHARVVSRLRNALIRQEVA
jgi:RNA polymerase sigma factor FliA